jgi:pilus assembly protein Flp/PilA
MYDLLARFAQDESGTAALEYGLIAALISIPIISAARDTALAIRDTFNQIARAME